MPASMAYPGSCPGAGRWHRTALQIESKYDRSNTDSGASPYVTDGNVDAAIQYVAAQKGADNRITHADEFMQQVVRCMDNNRLQSTTQVPQRGDYKFVNMGDDDEELRLKFSRVYPEVSKYLKDYNIDDVDPLAPEDYKDRFSDMETNEDSYILDSSKQTRGLNRCVAIDTHALEEKLDVDLDDIRRDDHRRDSA